MKLQILLLFLVIICFQVLNAQVTPQVTQEHKKSDKTDKQVELKQEEPQFINQEIVEECGAEIKPSPPRPAMPPPPPPAPPSVCKEIFRVVEEMPYFYSEKCKELTSNREKKQCAKAALGKYIADNLQYPTEAREKSIEGTVVVRFVVERDGSLSNIVVLRKLGNGTDAETIRLIESMPNWIPGKQRGHIVPVLYNLPIKFILK